MDMFHKSEDAEANLVGKVMVTVFIKNFDQFDPYSSSSIEVAWFEGRPLSCVKAPKKIQQVALGLSIKEFLSLADKVGYKCGKPRRFLADGMEEVNVETE